MKKMKSKNVKSFLYNFIQASAFTAAAAAAACHWLNPSILFNSEAFKPFLKTKTSFDLYVDLLSSFKVKFCKKIIIFCRCWAGRTGIQIAF